MARRIVLILVVLAAATCVAGANEVIKFKNGHHLVVEKSRTEGETLFVTLLDGSLLGFPRELIIDEPRAARRIYSKGRANIKASGGRGPRGTELAGYRREKGMLAEGNIKASDATSNNSQQVGYSRPTGTEQIVIERPKEHPGFNARDYVDRITGDRGGSRATRGFHANEGQEAAAPESETPQLSVRQSRDVSRSGRIKDDQ